MPGSLAGFGADRWHKNHFFTMSTSFALILQRQHEFCQILDFPG
jgi:hypothetical protein